MFKQIDKKNYKTIKSFVNQYKYKVSVNSILDGNTQGEVFADDAENPTIVLIWDKSILVQIFGEMNIVSFNSDLKQLLDQHIAPICAKSNEPGLLIAFFPENYWVPFCNQIIEQNYLLKGFRWVGELDMLRYQEIKSKFTTILPDGFKLCKVTEEILSAEQNKEFKDETLGSWVEADNFLSKGLGYCIIKENKVIASTVSCGVADKKYYEISIDTFDEQERRKGLATHCAIAYIDHCLADNSLPHWGTEWDNFASQNLATKIGFIGSVNENRYQFRFNRTDNYLVNTFCHIRDNKEIDMSYVNLAVNKAVEDRNIKANPRYLYSVALKLTESGINNHVFFLLNELFKSDIQYLDHVKNTDAFKPLHNTPEWQELIAKYA